LVLKPILTTKFYIPPARTGLLPRTRLVEQLSEGATRQLTLVSATAGFGKTTLLSQWIAKSIQPVAWLSLDEGDNDPDRFLTYLILALQQIQDGIGANTLDILTSSQTPSFKLILTNLINEIAVTKTHFNLILDDYHVITEQQIHHWLSFLMENQPEPMHLVIATRNDPPWPLARLRSRREILEIRSKDLRFTSAETSSLFKDILALDLSTEDVQLLDERVEGWIAGLQMAALSLQGREQVSEFIREFTGSNRFILDYLFEEILSAQTPEIQDFLLRSSVLDRLTAPLCQTVTGIRDSQEILEYLDRANLFLVPLDDKRSWYRYHHLFGDLLRVLLARKYPTEVSDLQLAASHWSEKNDLLIEALK
jgi:LuxR family maltose regulon positive regulatory protein